MVDQEGDFEFPGVAPAFYVLRVMDTSGNVVAEQFVNPAEGYDRVEIRLSAPKGAKPGTGTASLAQLLHKVPGPALKEYRNGLKAVGKNDFASGRRICRVRSIWIQSFCKRTSTWANVICNCESRRTPSQHLDKF